MKKAATPFWKELVDHVDKTWTLKKRGARYMWAGKDFHHLRRAVRYYEPWGVMALWDLYIGSSDEFAVRQGYTVTEFVRQIPRLVDGDWKARAQRHQDRLMPLRPQGVKQVQELVGSALRGKEIERSRLE